MVEWLLQSFPNSDKEISTVHVPLLLGQLVRWLNVSLQRRWPMGLGIMS
jgi:hypothetical protein